MAAVNRFFHALKAVKTFSIVVAVLTFCVLTPTVVGLVLYKTSYGLSCEQLWFVVFHYEFYGINSIVNAYIYGMRHIKYRKAYGHILVFKIVRCNILNSPTDIKNSGSRRTDHPLHVTYGVCEHARLLTRNLTTPAYCRRNGQESELQATRTTLL